MIDWLIGLYLVWFGFANAVGLEHPADTAAHDALPADAGLHEPAELLTAEVHADGRGLEGERNIVLRIAAVREEQPRARGQLGIQAHVRPVQPRELHQRHRAQAAQLEIAVGRLVAVLVHTDGLRRHIVAQDRPAEAEPVIGIMHILDPRGAVHMRILERSMPQGEHHPEHLAQHIGKLRNSELPIRNGKLVPVLVILGKDGHNDDKTQQKSNEFFHGH